LLLDHLFLSDPDSGSHLSIVFGGLKADRAVSTEEWISGPEISIRATD